MKKPKKYKYLGIFYNKKGRKYYLRPFNFNLFFILKFIKVMF